MNLEKQELAELISTVVKETIKELGIGANSITNTVEGVPLKGGNVEADPSKGGKTAYQKTEQLLFNYRAFKRIVQERMQEVEDLKRYGVPGKAASYEYTPHSNTVHGLTLPADSVEVAVQKVLASVESTVQAIALIDKCMASLKGDPYYAILEMRYFEGRTQEDIAMQLGCAQKTISQNKGRLVKELAMRLFPNQVIDEIMR